MTDSISTSNLNFDQKNKIPQFYFPGGFVPPEILENDENLISKFFTEDELTEEQFIPITSELLEFPKMFNSILFKKCLKENSTKVSKVEFLK